MSAEPVVLQIITGRGNGTPAGFDSTIISVPGRWYADMPDGRVFLPQLAAIDLRRISEQQARLIGQVLDHAEWTITADPDLVTTIGLRHGCGFCRAGVDRAIAYLADHPGAEVAAGTLWWAAQ